MSGDSGRQIDERTEVLELARPDDGKETFHGAFAGFTPCAE